MSAGENLLNVMLELFLVPSSLLWITQHIIGCLNQLKLIRRLLGIVQVFVWKFHRDKTDVRLNDSLTPG